MSHAVNSNFFFFCLARWRSLGLNSVSLHHLSFPPITKQNTQNWFPWQHGEPNLEQLEVKTAHTSWTCKQTWTHIFTSTMTQFCSHIMMLWISEDCIFRHLLHKMMTFKKKNTTSNSHYMRENSPCILFLYYTISGYSWNQNINANASPTRDTALGHSLTKGGLICKMNKIVIWPHRNCDVTGKTPCLLHVLRLKLCTYTPLYK